MKKNIIIIFIIISVIKSAYSQSKIEGRFEVGYLLFTHVDSQKINLPSLQEKLYGVDINMICGLEMTQKAFIGIGIGYLNFDLNNSGIQGLSAFSTFEFLPPSYRKVNLYFRSNLGYSQLWSRNNNETGTLLVELNIGLKQQLNRKMQISLHSGVLFTQNSFLIPIRLGIGLK